MVANLNQYTVVSLHDGEWRVRGAVLIDDDIIKAPRVLMPQLAAHQANTLLFTNISHA